MYNAFAGGQAGGFGGVGSGTDIGILNHELGHALSLPHWGDNAAYPYKGDMYGIQAPANYNETHAGPAWAFHLPTRAFIPPTSQPGNVGGKPVGVYKVDPMQGGGQGWQEPAYLMNHFSDYSVNQMRDYLHSHVVVWNPALNSYASWNQTAGDYTTTVTNNGVQFPTTRDVQVISIMASVSGSNPSVNMVYPPIGPYTSGLIRLFDPTVAADRPAAQSIFSPTNGSDYCVRVVQGGVTKTYMLAASNLSSVSPFDSASLITEAINLPASGGAVTKIELLSTPNVEDVGLPANPTVLYTWAPLMPEPGTFDLPPTANSSSAITMTALPGAVAFGFTGGTMEYLFTETSGNPGGSSSAWQTSRSYTDTGLQPNTHYTYTVSMRAGTLATTASAPASATTPSAGLANSITVNATEAFSLQSGSGYKAVTGLGTFDAATADKLVVVVGAENANNDHFAIVGVRYNGVQMIEAVQQTGITADGAVAIYYLDNPGPVGTGITVSSYNPNGGLGVAYALSGTRPGFGAFNSRKGNAATSLPLTTSAANSIVIAALENSGNTGSAGTPTANAPLTQTASGNWGSQWGSLASGYVQVGTTGTVTPSFVTGTGGSFSINIAAVEFLSEAIPGSTWVQTAGNAQAWTTAANWIMNSVPSTVAGDTVDFSTVNIAANTTLTLGANRTGRLWKFGDTSGAETWTVNAGNSIILGGTTPTIEVVNNSAQLNCVVTGTAGLVKTGTGALVLMAANTYTGGTTLTSGTLSLGSASAIGNGPLTIGSASNPMLRNDSGSAITMPNNRMVWAGNFRHAGNGLNLGTGTVSITANATQDISGTLTVGGVVSGAFGLNKFGGATLVLNGLNTFTGQTNLRQGTLTINTLRNYGAASSLGAPTTTNIVLASTNSSTLNYLGDGDTTDRPVQIGGVTTGAVTATIANNGTGALVFSAADFFSPVAMTGGGARVLALGGSFGTVATPNEIRGVIADNILNGATAPANRVTLTKNGTGAWKLSAVNTYTGPTSISGGTLSLGTNNALPPTDVTIANATLNAATFTDSVGTLDITGSAVINMGAGAALAFASSTAPDWTDGTLTITGTFVSGSSLRFGTGSAGLTSTQLSRISKPGGGAVALNASGFLIDAPLSGYASWASTNAPGSTPGLDHDLDGVSNGLEYVLGGTALTDDMSRLPAASPSGGNILFTFQRTQASINASTALSISVGTNLLTWPTTYNVGADTASSSAGVTVQKGVPAGFDTVTLSVPRSPDLQKFIRLNVTITP